MTDVIELVKITKVEVSKVDRKRRVMLQFNDGPGYELPMHQVLGLICSLSNVVGSCVPSEVEIQAWKDAAKDDKGAA